MTATTIEIKDDIIASALEHCITETNLEQGRKIAGKVRDIYELENELLILTTDRLSAFDRSIASIPFKGQVLNQVSAWWFDQTKHIIPNHMLSCPEPNSMLVKKCQVFPVEFVVRGYVTGSTSTSMWTQYANGVRDYCGHQLPEGLVKNQMLTKPLLTPTTKDVDHDRPISCQEIVNEGLMSVEDLNYVSNKVLELYEFGSNLASEHGLILVDTKYELGKDENGDIILLDEIHTPDSSRYWLQKSYHERFSNGLEPESIDKEFIRLWFSKNCDPYNDVELPDAPKELIIELSKRYILLYQLITGNQFEPKVN